MNPVRDNPINPNFSFTDQSVKEKCSSYLIKKTRATTQRNPLIPNNLRGKE